MTRVLKAVLTLLTLRRPAPPPPPPARDWYAAWLARGCR